MSLHRFAWFLVCLTISAGALAEEPQDEDRTPQLMIDSQGFSGVRVQAMALSNDQRWLAAAGGKEVRIWNLQTGQLRATLHGYQEPPGYQIGTVKAVCFSPDSKYLIVGVSDNTSLGSTRVYDMNDLTKIDRLIKGHTGCTLGVAVSPDGHYLATYGCGGHLFVIDLRELANRGEKYISSEYRFNDGYKADYACNYFGFPAGNDWVLLRYEGKQVLVSVRDQKLITNPQDWPDELLYLQRNEPKGLNFSTPAEIHLDGKFWYARGGVTEDLRSGAAYWVAVWDKSSSSARTFYREHYFNPVAVTVNATTGIVASADVFGDICVWEAATAKTLWRLRAKNQHVFRVAWSADGQSLLFSDQPYEQSEYNYNRFGPITRQFTLKNRHIVSADSIPDDPAVPTRPDPETGASASLSVPIPKPTDDNAPVQFYLELKSGEASLAKFYLDGRPYAYKFVSRPLDGMGRLPLFAGGFTGELYQLGLEADFDRSATETKFLTIFQKYVGHSNAVTSVAESPDGKLLASSSLDGTIRLWRVRSPRHIGDISFVMDGNRVKAVPPDDSSGVQLHDEIITFDGFPFYERMRRMAEGRYEAGQRVTLTIRRQGAILEKEVVLKLSTDVVEPLATIFFSRDGEWVMWSQAGYYDASSRGGDYVGWHVNQARDQPARFYPVSQFSSRLYRPNLIGHLLRTRDLQQAIRLASAEVASLPNAPRLDVDIRRPADFERVKPPEIRVLEPENGSVSTKQSVRVRAKISASRQVPLRDVDFRVNDRPPSLRYLRQEESQTEGDTVATLYTQEVVLRPGLNTVSIHALNAASTKATEQITLSYQPPVEPQAYKPSLYTLAVGISKYAQKQHNLEFAHQDALDFTAVWKAQEGKFYNRVESKTLINEEATVGAIQDAMQWISMSARNPRDVVFVHFSGHALYDAAGQWRLAAHELDTNRLNRTTISHAEVGSWLDNTIRANVILFVDTCHAAGVKAVGGVSARPPAGANIWRGSGTLVFSSCMPEETSIEDPRWKHGAFTEAILRGLSNPETDKDGDGKITFTELELFVKGEVRRMTDKRQNPVAEKPGTVSEVELATFR
jgi:WD40 repeat protein